MAKQPRILAGQVVAVTGAARGIGKATASALAREGMKVAIGDLDLAEARRAAEEIGSGVVALELNVTDRASFERFVEETEAKLGPLDVLVNNAGIMPVGPFLDEDDATAQRIVDIDLHGVILGMKIAMPGMLQRGRGHVVNIASQAGKVGIPGIATYAAAKHAVVGLTEATRLEFRGSGVEFSCVMPNLVRTELGTGVEMPRGVKELTPEDVADAIVHALQHNRFDVFVPGYLNGIIKTTSILPRRMREGIGRAMKADRIMLEADHSARRSYEIRAAHSEPGLEPADEPGQLTEKAGS
jgi:NADP-dependent 3-hydroxy acid dehydrogenase YdfG